MAEIVAGKPHIVKSALCRSQRHHAVDSISRGFLTVTQAYWQRVLHSYDKSNTGLISVQDFRNALDRLNVALSEQEKAKVSNSSLP
jgi:hypothetical protein